MYYLLTVDLAAENVYLEQESDQMVSLISGRVLSDDTEAPFRYSMEVDVDEDGTPMPPRMSAYFPGDSVMHNSLVAALRQAGVDNIQTFPAVIRNDSSGEVHEDYVVVNVVGLVSCANVQESETEPLADVYYFHSLVIDPSKTHDMLLFRLAESQMEIIVHDAVADEIRRGGFPGVVLQPLEERRA